MYRVFVFFVFLSFCSCHKRTVLPETIPLHENWVFKGTDTLGWQKATVPGNIFSDLLENTVINDPFIETNEDKVQWVSTKDWIYKTTFTVSKETLNKQHIYLDCKGLDTYATLYLNDELLATTTNAFRSYQISVKGKLKRKNTLKIVFASTSKKENQKKQGLPYTLPGGDRVFTRKAQFQYGWDWGPKLNTSGIWKPIALYAWDHMIFEDIFIKELQVDKEKAVLEGRLTIKSDMASNAVVHCTVNGERKKFPILLKKGKHVYKIPLEISKPKLWWTHNLGTPYRYNFDFVLESKNGIHDKKNIKKGIRNLRLVTQNDSIGTSFYFVLNGKPIYSKGANYIPQNSFYNKVTKQHYEQLLSDVVDSNMNMLRVWGGGIYEKDLFYELCDAKGILVWQDFMFACAMYPGDEEFLENVQEEALEQVKRLRNHASIALWCGNNENAEGWHRWGWQDAKSEEEKKAIWSGYQKLFHTLLPSVVQTYSDGISYWESSPKYGRGNPKYEFEGDAHDWWVWHDAAPFEHFNEKVPRFMSEYGFQSFPSFPVIQKINQKKHLALETEAMRSHQKHPRGFSLIKEYMARDYNVPSAAEDYIYVSQLLQARGITLGIEAHRRAKPRNMGTLYWQLNDCWPAISWSSIDYFGNWKALQYKAKKAYKNLLISSEIQKDSVYIYIINDRFETIQGTLKASFQDFDGTVISTLQKQTEVAPNSSIMVQKISLKKIDKFSHILVLNFQKEQKMVYLSKPKNLLLQQSPIETTVSHTKNGFAIRLKAKTLHKDIFLYTSKKGRFSDNFFDLLPNKEITIVFQTLAKDIDDLQIKSLNSMHNKYGAL